MWQVTVQQSAATITCGKQRENAAAAAAIDNGAVKNCEKLRKRKQREGGEGGGRESRRSSRQTLAGIARTQN